MARQKITSRLVGTLKSRAEREGKPLLQWDSETKGFGCRVSAKGDVSWLVQKWQGGRGGKAQRYSFKADNIDEARKEAERLIGDVRSGVDLPSRRREKRKAKREALNAAKLSDAVDLYLKLEAKGHSESYWTEVRRKFNREIVPDLGKDTLVCEITKADIRSLIEAKQSKGQHGAARYLFATLRPFFKWCAEREVFVDVGGKSPIDGMKAPKALEDRDRVLTDDEIKAFWAATYSDELFGPFHRLLLLTAQRRDEVAGMEWSEIKGDVWTIPGARTKNGKTHIVHLSRQALETIAQVPKIEGRSLLFSTTGDTPISGYGKAKGRLDELMGVSDWRLHDLRRTARTRLAELKVPKEVASKILNHTPKGKDVDDVYQRYEYLDQRKAALEKWGRSIANLVANTTVQSNVVSFAKASMVR